MSKRKDACLGRGDATGGRNGEGLVLCPIWLRPVSFHVSYCGQYSFTVDLRSLENTAASRGLNPLSGPGPNYSSAVWQWSVSGDNSTHARLCSSRVSNTAGHIYGIRWCILIIFVCQCASMGPEIPVSMTAAFDSPSYLHQSTGFRVVLF